MGNRLQSCSVIPSHKSGRLSHTLIVEHRRWHATVVQLLEKWCFRVQVWLKNEERERRRGGSAAPRLDRLLGVWESLLLCGSVASDPPEERNVGVPA